MDNGDNGLSTDLSVMVLSGYRLDLKWIIQIVRFQITSLFSVYKEIKFYLWKLLVVIVIVSNNVTIKGSIKRQKSLSE